MKKEKALIPETMRPPTTLNLFSYKGEERINAQETAEIISRYRADFVRAREGIYRLHDEMDLKVQRLIEASDGLSGQWVEFKSSRASGKAYLTMLDEFLPKGLTEKEVFQFFILCLKINTRYTQVRLRQQKTVGREKARYINTVKDLRPTETDIEAIVEREASNPPSWFKGDRKTWKAELTYYGRFSLYLNPDIEEEHLKHQKPVIILPGDRLGETVEQGFPDWFDPEKGPPLRKVVEEEFLEDTEEQEKLNQQFSSIQNQLDYFKMYGKTKFSKAASRYELYRRRTFERVRTLADLVCYLSATENVHEYTLTEAELVKASEEQIIKSIIMPDKTREKAIREYFVKYNLTPEIIALWLEREFRRAGVISAQDKIDDHFISSCLDFFNYLERENNDTRSEELPLLRYKDRKLYRVLYYNIKPLFEELNGDERSYLSELLNELNGVPYESFMKEFSYLLSGKTGFENRTLSESIQKFGINWVKSHWKWASEQSARNLTSIQVKTVSEVVSEEEKREEAAELEEYEVIVQESQEGSLAGWTVFYSLERNTHQDNLRLLEGRTLEEREEGWRKFRMEEGVICSIKDSSIIHALDWIASIPEDIFSTWHAIQFNGDEFKKFKRGKVRMLLIRDTEKKRLIFTIHQKKDWGYIRRSER